MGCGLLQVSFCTFRQKQVSGRVGSAALRKTGLHFSRLHLTLGYHVVTVLNQRLIYNKNFQKRHPSSSDIVRLPGSLYAIPTWAE